MSTRRLLLVPALAAGLVLTSCVFVTTSPRPVVRPGFGLRQAVNVPAKAHLIDGAVVIFPSGIELDSSRVYARPGSTGLRYPLGFTGMPGPVSSVLLDSVGFLEQYNRRFDVPSCLLSLPAVATGAAAGLAVLLVAIFGSCPTVYSWDGAKYVLEAEAFSYSVSRTTAAGDLDRLDELHTDSGAVRLLLTNEALETHHINELSLLAVDHSADFEAFPTDAGRVLLFGLPQAELRAVNRLGRDVTAEIASRDDRWYATDSALTAQLPDSAVHDWLDLSVPIPQGSRKLVMALRYRNTLLNTALLYDVMLADQGARALDWQARDLNNPFYLWRFGNWYSRHFRIHVKVPRGNGMREVKLIRDTGPITWHLTAFELPVTPGETAHFRLETIADNVHLDWVGASFQTAPCRPVPVGCREIEQSGEALPDLLPLFAATDHRELVTGPGESYTLTFDAPPATGEKRTWFVKTHGWYSEWLRGHDLGREPVALDLSDASVRRAGATWLRKKADMERRFYELKVPITRGQ